MITKLPDFELDGGALKDGRVHGGTIKVGNQTLNLAAGQSVDLHDAVAELERRAAWERDTIQSPIGFEGCTLINSAHGFHIG